MFYIWLAMERKAAYCRPVSCEHLRPLVLADRGPSDPLLRGPLSAVTPFQCCPSPPIHSLKYHSMQNREIIIPIF